MADREKVIKGLEELSSFLFQAYSKAQAEEANLFYERFLAVDNAIELLKEKEAVVKEWTKEIADNQLAHAPKDSHEFMSLNEHLENEYKRGIWDGLQIAWNIISEGR